MSKANCSIPTKVARGFPSSSSASEVSDENKPENAQNAAASKNTASSPLTSSKSAATAKADASSQPDSKVKTEDCQWNHNKLVQIQDHVSKCDLSEVSSVLNFGSKTIYMS